VKWTSCVHLFLSILFRPLGFLVTKYLKKKTFDLPIFWIWAYLMKVISEASCVHQIILFTISILLLDNEKRNDAHHQYHVYIKYRQCLLFVSLHNVLSQWMVKKDNIFFLPDQSLILHLKQNILKAKHVF
jgi:hypothetical protein